MRRRSKQRGDKVQYINIVGVAIYQLFILAGLAFWYYVLCLDIMFDKTIDWFGYGFILAMLIFMQVMLVLVWKERKEALKKIKEWQDAGTEVRYWDSTRRHYYPLPKK
jgi:hypothetical protein